MSGPVTLDVVIQDQDVRGIVDSGASRCVMDLGTLEMLGVDTSSLQASNANLVDASNNRMKLAGVWVANVFVSKLNRT